MNVAHLLQQTIYIARATSSTAWGEAGYGAPEAIAARVEWATGVGPSGEGEEATTRATIVTLASIGEKDRIWLPRKGEQDAREADTSDVSKARTPNAEGCEPAVSLSGVTSHYVTKV